MFKHILVPLDGSKLAEVVLPAVARLASGMHAKVTLIHIIEKNPPEAIHGDRHLVNESEAREYLRRVIEQSFNQGVEATYHVHTEQVSKIAASISAHAEELQPDLIVMCSHGNGGLRDLLAGSVAQQIVAPGKTPILLVKPHPAKTPGKDWISPEQFKQFLVALDGDPQHELSLITAGNLAQFYKADLNLVTVVHYLDTLPGEKKATGRFLPASTALLLDMAEEDAVEHLQQLALPWTQAGCRVTITVERGEPSQTILQVSERLNIDLLVLGTHGKAGLAAFWAGSVGAKLISQSRSSLFLVPVG